MTVNHAAKLEPPIGFGSPVCSGALYLRRALDSASSTSLAARSMC